MSTTSYPLIMTGLEQAAVVGGGDVACRKVEGLLDAGVLVRVISPDLTPALRLLAVSGRITHVPRAYRSGDLEGAQLAIAATGDRAVNAAVYAEARQRGLPVNVVDDPEHCTFHVPSVIRRGPLTVTISTGGGSPRLAARLRQTLEGSIGPEYGALSEILGEWRPWVLRNVAAEARAGLWDAVIDAMLPLLRQGREAEGRLAGWELTAGATGAQPPREWLQVGRQIVAIVWSMQMPELVMGTRGSRLARAQTEWVVERRAACLSGLVCAPR